MDNYSIMAGLLLGILLPQVGANETGQSDEGEGFRDPGRAGVWKESQTE